MPNTIVLTVDVATGKAVMLNQTPFPQEIEGYTILGRRIAHSTRPVGTRSTRKASKRAIGSPARLSRPGLTELQEDGTTTFDNATPFDLGKILLTERRAGSRLRVRARGRPRTDARHGSVYILAGDYNDDEVVDAADYTVWRDHLDTELDVCRTI